MATARIVLDLDEQRLRSWAVSPAGSIFMHVRKLTAKVETKAKVNASGPVVRVRTGNLRSSIHSNVEVRGSSIVGVVACDAAYALAVHEGSRPHVIEPARAKVIAFQGPAGPVFTRSVQHPGARGRPFLRDALSAVNE